MCLGVGSLCVPGTADNNVLEKARQLQIGIKIKPVSELKAPDKGKGSKFVDLYTCMGCLLSHIASWKSMRRGRCTLQDVDCHDHRVGRRMAKTIEVKTWNIIIQGYFLRET